MKLTKPLQISMHTQITTEILWTWWRRLHDTTSLGDARRSTSPVCQMSPLTYWNYTMRSTTKTHSLSLLSSSETPYWVKCLMKDVRSGETWWKTPTSPWIAKKHGQPSVVLGQTMSPLPWSLLSLLTTSLTNYCLMEEGWNTKGHPASTTKQSFQVTTSHQLSLLSLSAWTNSQLASACWKQGKLLAWMIY